MWSAPGAVSDQQYAERDDVDGLVRLDAGERHNEANMAVIDR